MTVTSYTKAKVDALLSALTATITGKADTADLATVATTGTYADLTGKPTIPAVPGDIGAQPAGDYATNTALTTGLSSKVNTSTYTSGLAAKQDTATLAADVAAHVADGSALATALGAAFVPFWAPSETVATGTVRVDATGHLITANSNRTTRASYDTTEQAAWTVVSGGGGGGAVTSVAGRTGVVVLTSTDLSDSTATGQALVSAASAAAARSTLGLGSAATQPTSAFDAAGAASTAQGASLQKTSNLSDLGSAATARTNLGLGSVATKQQSTIRRREQFVSAYQSAATNFATNQASGISFRHTHKLVVDATDVRLIVPVGAKLTPNTTGTDELAPAAVPIKASLEIAGAIRPVLFRGGVRQVSDDPGGILVSDLISADLASGTQVPVRVFGGSASAPYPNTVGTGQGPGATATGDGFSPGSDITDSTAAVGVTVTTGFVPHGLVGVPANPVPAVAFIGDSIVMGTGDGTNNGGWTAYASNGTVPNLRLSVGGASAQGWAVGHSYSFPLLDYCTHALVLLGANDGMVPRTLTQFKADMTAIYTALKRRGLKVYGCTILPRTVSQSNMAAASAFFAAGGSSPRGQANAWIRAGADGLLDGFFETADAVETGRDTGVWVTTPTSYVSDGAHPTTAGHQAIAAAVNLASLTLQ